MSAIIDNHAILLFWLKNKQTFHRFSLWVLHFVLCLLNLHVLRAQRGMGFFLLITHKSTRSEKPITWLVMNYQPIRNDVNWPLPSELRWGPSSLRTVHWRTSAFEDCHPEKRNTTPISSNLRCTQDVTERTAPTETECWEVLSVLVLCAPSNRRRPFSYHTKMADFEYFRVLSVSSWKIGRNSEKCTEYGK